MTPEPTQTVLVTTDGATISLTTQGSGPHLVCVPSVASSRSIDPQPDLAATLATHFTVTTYDRRGTGQSTLPEGAGPDDYAVEQEIDDLALIAQHLGGPVDVYGFSSGADLALLAAQAGAPIRRLYLLEPPLFEAGSLRDERSRMRELVEQDRQAARDYYLRDVVGIPAEIVEQIPTTDQHLADVPASLHELAFLPGCTAQRFHGLETPTLLMVSSTTAPQLRQWAADLGNALGSATLRELAGEWHGVPAATQLTAMLAAADHDWH